jgi:long-chain acyl-CoA synthetase
MFRTGGLGVDTPHETPPMRQNSASLDMPQLRIGDSATTADAAAATDSMIAAEIETSTQQVRQEDILFEKALVRTLTYMTKVYDTLTLPVYAALQQPWKRIAEHEAPKGILLDKEKMIYGTLTPTAALHREIDACNVDTMEKIFAHACAKHEKMNCLGVRDIISEEEVEDPQTGKMIKKYQLGDYKWNSYYDTGVEAKNLSVGILSLGIKPKEKIAVFAETRKEWLVTAMAAFKQNLRIVTVFTTLGDDGVAHALNETDVCTLVTSEDLMPRLQEILKSTPGIKNLVYMDTKKAPSTAEAIENLPKEINVTTYSNLMEIGRANASKVDDVKPQKDDIAIIMYTSGSTGAPKGVMLSHYNLVSGIKSVTDVLSVTGEPEPGDAYIAYLPLAHVMELMSEAICFLQGIPIGYSSPLTMTDKSLGIKDGTKGDATMLRPTLIAGVPLVIERIAKGIQTKVSESGRFAEILFNFFYNYKVRWTELGYDTPLVNKVFFSKIRAIVGGKLRFMAVGSAPLAPETQKFIRTTLCCPVVLGYAMTESASCGTMAVSKDLSVGRVGAPVSCTNFRLVDWTEGGYRVTDKPYPRGEILMGGDNIAIGYYKRESDDIFEEDGKRWIRTGDIGEVHPDGVFKIIDRKKDLVKLANGEYVSLGKVESAIKTCKYVDNVCVYADPSESYTIAIIVPTQPHVEKLGRRLGKSISYELLCQDPVIEETILQEVQTQARLLKLVKYEIPRKIRLCPEPWMPQSGLVTAAFKIKRNNVYRHFEKQISEMYNWSS